MSSILNLDQILTLRKKLRSKLPMSGTGKQSGRLEESLHSIHRNPVFKRNVSIRRVSHLKENNRQGMLQRENSNKVNENSLLCESIRPVQLTDNPVNPQKQVSAIQEKEFEFAVPQAKAPRAVRKGRPDIIQRTLEDLNEFYDSPILTEAEASYHLMICHKNMKHFLAKHSKMAVYEQNGRTFSSNSNKSVSAWINNTGCSAHPVAYASSMAGSSSSYDNINPYRYGIDPRMSLHPVQQNQHNHHSLGNSKYNLQQCSMCLRRQSILRNIACREPQFLEDDLHGPNNSIRNESGRIVHRTSMYWQTGLRNNS